VTRTPLSRSKGQRSKVKSPGRFTYRGVNASGSCSGERGNVLAVGTYCYVAVCTLQALSARRREALRRPQRERGGAYCGGRPPYSLLKVCRCCLSKTKIGPCLSKLQLAKVDTFFETQGRQFSFFLSVFLSLILYLLTKCYIQMYCHVQREQDNKAQITGTNSYLLSLNHRYSYKYNAVHFSTFSISKTL